MRNRGIGDDDLPKGHGKRGRGGRQADKCTDSELSGSTHGKLERVTKRQKGSMFAKVQSWDGVCEVERVDVTGRDQGCEMKGNCETVKSWMIVAGMGGWNGNVRLTNQWLNKENATGKS
jgi:hypothetical protein